MDENALCIKYDESNRQHNCSLITMPTSSGLDALLNVHLSGIVSKEFREMFEYVVDLWLCSILSYICIAVNVIAIVVLTKMGFKETVNISLTAIAMWDIVKGVCSAFMKLYGPIQFASEALAYNWQSYTMVILGNFYGVAGYVSGMMAVFVAMERCLCVSLPFTVKHLLTRNVVIGVNLAISFGVVVSYVVVYVQYTFKKITHPTLNQTVRLYTYSDSHYKYPRINQYIKTMSMVYPLFSFITICLCSAITVYQLREASKSKVRSSSTLTNLNGKEPKQLSHRDRQVTKMLLVVIAVYIGCYIPRICHYVILNTVPEYLPHGRYANILWVIATVMFFFDTINATANPFILFSMSSHFRNTFFHLFNPSKKH